MFKILATSLIAAGMAILSSSALADDLKIGIEGAYPPFNYVDNAGNPAGFEVEFANALCAKANLTCTFVVQDWDGIIPGLNAKKFDVIIASMSITDDRRKSVDFSKPYYHEVGTLLGRKDSGIDPTSDLAGVAVGVQRGTVHENYLRAKFPQADVRLYGSFDEAIQDLLSGRIALVTGPKLNFTLEVLGKPGGEDFQFIGPDLYDKAFHGEGVGMAVRKGDTKLLATLNGALDRIVADGEYNALSIKYFKSDLLAQ